MKTLSTPLATTPGAPGRRPTMKDVAALVGVHQTTVSLALRDHPGIPVATREKIREAAARIGYRPDPALDAFNFYRLSNHPIRTKQCRQGPLHSARPLYGQSLQVLALLIQCFF